MCQTSSLPPLRWVGGFCGWIIDFFKKPHRFDSWGEGTPLKQLHNTQRWCYPWGVEDCVNRHLPVFLHNHKPPSNTALWAPSGHGICLSTVTPDADTEPQAHTGRAQLSACLPLSWQAGGMWTGLVLDLGDLHRLLCHACLPAAQSSTLPPLLGLSAKPITYSCFLSVHKMGSN